MRENRKANEQDPSTPTGSRGADTHKRVIALFERAKVAGRATAAASDDLCSRMGGWGYRLRFLARTPPVGFVVDAEDREHIRWKVNTKHTAAAPEQQLESAAGQARREQVAVLHVLQLQSKAPHTGRGVETRTRRNERLPQQHALAAARFCQQARAAASQRLPHSQRNISNTPKSVCAWDAQAVGRARQSSTPPSDPWDRMGKNGCAPAPARENESCSRPWWHHPWERPSLSPPPAAAAWAPS